MRNYTLEVNHNLKLVASNWAVNAEQEAKLERAEIRIDEMDVWNVTEREDKC